MKHLPYGLEIAQHVPSCSLLPLCTSALPPNNQKEGHCLHATQALPAQLHLPASGCCRSSGPTQRWHFSSQGNATSKGEEGPFLPSLSPPMPLVAVSFILYGSQNALLSYLLHPLFYSSPCLSSLAFRSGCSHLKNMIRKPPSPKCHACSTTNADFHFQEVPLRGHAVPSPLYGAISGTSGAGTTGQGAFLKSQPAGNS